MTTINDIVTVNITRSTTAVTRTGFNIPLFLDTFVNFPERTRRYSSLKAVAADFDSGSTVYKAAAQLFGQDQKPANIIIGRRAATSATLTPSASTQTGEVYSFTIVNAQGAESLVTFTTSAATTAATAIVTGLKESYDALSADKKEGVTMTFTTGVITLTAGAYKLATSNLASVVTSTESWGDAAQAVLRDNSDWYALTASTHTLADQLVLAEFVQAQERIYGTSTSSADAYGVAVTDIGAVLKDRNYTNTFVVWSAQADAEFPECAAIGRNLQAVAGSNNWNFKQLSGVSKINLNDTQIANLKSKNYNFVEEVSGVRYFTDGKVVSGEWIDVMILIHWTAARIRERTFALFINNPKVAYTQEGLTQIEAGVRAVLSEGVDNGGYARTPKFTVSVPDVRTIDPNLKALRILEGVKFSAVLAGAINAVRIDGTVTLA